MVSTQHPVVVVLGILFVLWLVFPEGEYQGTSLTHSDLAIERISKFRDALDVLNTSRWGDFQPRVSDDDKFKPSYLNLSGFRREDDFAWQDLARFRERSLSFSRHAMSSSGRQSLWDLGRGDALWANASGTVHGEWIRREGSVPRAYDSYNLTDMVPGMDWVGNYADWARNITGSSGRMMLRIDGNKTVTPYEQLSDKDSSPLSGGLVRNIKGTTTIEDTDGSGHNWEMRLWGLHWPRQGVILMTTTSEKFEGIFGLPHLTPSKDFFLSGQMLLNQTLEQTLDKKEENIYIDQTQPWSSDLENPMYTYTPSPHCEYIMYAQVHPPDREKLLSYGKDASPEKLASAISAIESELQSPQGAPIKHIPSLQMSAVVYSPDCGFFLETRGPPDAPPSEAQHLRGMKTEVHIHQVKTWLIVYAVVIFAQVSLLKDQMKEACTPSTIGRVSFWTMSAMVIVDGMTFTAAATWVSSAAATFLPTLALLFSAFLSMTIGGSFLAQIHEIQLPETRPRRNERDQPAANAANSAAPSSTTSAAMTPDRSGSSSLLPNPVTASRPTPVIVPSDQDVDAEIAAAATAIPGATTAARAPSPQTFQAIIGRFILFSFGIIFLAISSTTWYPSLRALFLNACVMVYLSLWVPQILRNTRRNCRRALSWPFVIGQSILRLLPVAYFWLNENNFLYAVPDRSAFAVFAAWLWVQLVVLAAQDAIGPRFGVPSGWAPDAWDYHPVLREDSLEAGGLPIGLVAEDTPGMERATAAATKGESLRSIDCAICREVLEVPVLAANEDDNGVAGVFARRMYMVTPCRHIFHSACLEGWMRYRLQCPICREELPPL